MPDQLICPLGHRWDLSPDEPMMLQQPLTCPICGKVVDSASYEPTHLAEDSALSVTKRTPEPVNRRSAHTPDLPNYELLDVLGEGGMGRVYKARHRRLQRTVALKIIRAGAGASPQQLARFQIEAEALASLQHPNVVQIFEIGEGDACPFLALEFVDGGNLARAMAKQPQSPHRAAHLIEQLARAIHAAHQRGIVHRDLKPANVMLAADGTPKITDFGLAKRFEEDQAQTKTGLIMGTPTYMAPEQAKGAKNAIGPSVDIYSLGVILYEMLTGRVPFTGETTLETLQMVQQREPPLPSRIQPNTPKDLETICLKCLEKDPARRYANAEKLAEDLRRFRNNEPILARPTTAIERLGKWIKRQPALAALGAVSLTAAAALLGLGIWSYLTVSAARDRAEKKFALARQVVNDMYSKVAEEHLAYKLDQEPLQREFLAKALAMYEEFIKEKSDDPEVRRETALALFRVAQIHRVLHEDKKAETAFADAIAMQERLLAEFPRREDIQRDLAGSLNWRGEFYRESGNAPKQAEKDYLRALQLQTRLLTTHPNNHNLQREFARTHYNLGILELNKGQRGKAEAGFNHAVNLLVRLHDALPDDPNVAYELAVSHINRGVLYKRYNEHAKAMRDYELAIELLQKANKQQPRVFFQRELGVTSQNLGNLLAQEGEYRRAEKRLNDALERFKVLVIFFPNRPGYHKKLASTHNSLGHVLRKQNKLPEALGHWRDAEKVLSAVPPKVRADAEYQQLFGLVHGNMGIAAFLQKDFTEARERFAASVKNFSATLKINPDDLESKRFLRDQYRNSAETALMLKDHAAAATAARALAGVFDDAPVDKYHAACFLARAIPVADENKKKPATARLRIKTAYAHEVIVLLKGISGQLNAARRLRNEKEIFQSLIDNQAVRDALAKLDKN